MKNPLKITIILLAMFLISQFIGLYVNSVYLDKSTSSLPDFIEPPQNIEKEQSAYSIVIAIIIGIILVLVLINFKAEFVMRTWFFLVVLLALSICLNALFIKFDNSFLVSLAIALPLAVVKVYFREIRVHNLTELLIYPGIAVLFVPLLSPVSAIVLLILISLYDIWAVWHSSIMQKMAKFQIQKLKIFGGYFIPYKLPSLSNSSKSVKGKKIKVGVAILGGGDVVFPIILSGVFYTYFGIVSSLSVTFGSLLGLIFLFYQTEKGKFYPAMPFVTIGALTGFIVSSLFLNLF